MSMNDEERLVLNDKWDKQTIMEHIHRYSFALSMAKNKIILDAACGSGYGSGMLSKVAKKIEAIDVDPEAIDYAEKHYGNENIAFRKMSIAKLDYPDQYFDMIVSFETIEHVDKKTQKVFLKEAKRCLKPSGILLISTPNDELYRRMTRGKYHNPYHIAEFTEDSYKVFLHSCFEHVVIYYQNVSNASSLLREGNNKQINNGRTADNYHEMGRYYLALCSNTEQQKLPANDVYIPEINAYYHENYLDRKAFIVADLGKGWDGSNSIPVVSCEEGYTDFSFSFNPNSIGQNIKSLRFDPCETSCIIHDIKISSNVGNCSIKPINASQQMNGMDIFYNPDPMYQIDAQRFNDIHSITISGKIEDIPIQKAWESIEKEKKSLIEKTKQSELLLQDIKQAKRDLQLREDAYKELEEEREQLKTGLQLREDAYKELEEEMEQIKNELEIKNSDYKNLEEKNNLLNEKLLQKTDENNHNLLRINRLECDLHLRNNAYEDLTNHSNQVKEQLIQEKQKNNELENKIKNLNTRNQALEEQLDYVFMTRSWRITKPLRKIGNIIRFIRKMPYASPENWRSIIEEKMVADSSRSVIVETRNNISSITDDNKYRILLVSYYCPTKAHAGGLRILDLYRNIRRKCSNVYLVLYTHKRENIDWNYDGLEDLFDEVIFSPIEQLSCDDFIKISGFSGRFDVVDCQFLQAAEDAQSYKKISGRVLFTPMELLAKSLCDEMQNKTDNTIIEWIRKFDLAAREYHCVSNVDLTVCVSESDAVFLRKIQPASKVLALETGLSETEFPEILNSSFVRQEKSIESHIILYVAYFGSETNVKALLWYLDNVHPLVKQAIPDYILNVVGRGDLSPFANYHDENTCFIGEVDKLGEYIKKSKIGIAPALFGSGFRGKINQYAIYHVPCVANSLSACGLKYNNGIDILIGDTPEQFADGCIKLVADNQYNKKMGDEAYKTCLKNYTWQSKEQEIAMIYGLK